MYKILFVIVFAGSMWLGISKVDSLVAARAESQFEEKIPTIGLGPFLQLCREGNIVIIDLRDFEDFERSHIKGALSAHLIGGLTGADEEALVDGGLLTSRNIVLYSSGGVSGDMREYAQAVSDQGVQGLVFYSGGFREWLGAGLPVDKPPAAENPKSQSPNPK